MAGISVRRVLLAVLLIRATAAGAAGPGDLDPTFNGGAPVLLDLAKSAPKTTGFEGIAPAPDGGIMVAGATTDDAGNTALLLLRLSSAGSLDTSFASGGVRIVQAGRGDATHRPISYGLGVLPRPGGAGWIVTGGGSLSDGRRTMLAVAFTPNGDLDLNYGSGGSTRVPPPGASTVSNLWRQGSRCARRLPSFWRAGFSTRSAHQGGPHEAHPVGRAGPELRDPGHLRGRLLGLAPVQGVGRGRAPPRRQPDTARGADV